MDTSSFQCKVRECFCKNETEFFCAICSRDFCVRCHKIHSTNLSVADHDVVIYREKLPNFLIDEVCSIHPDTDSSCKLYCQTCEIPICSFCTEHRQHVTQDVRMAYEKQRQQRRKYIRIIRNDTICNREVLLSGVSIDFKTCQTFFSECQSKLEQKARALKRLLDTISSVVAIPCRIVLNYKIRNQNNKMRQYIAKVQTYEHRYENRLNRSIKFILFLKKKSLYQKQDSPSFPQNLLLTLAESVNIGDVSTVLSKIQLKYKGKRFLENKCLLQLLPVPIPLGCVKVADVHGCSHICNISSKMVWVSDENNLVLTNTKGKTVHRLDDLYYLQQSNKLTSLRSGLHTVNNKDELFYLNSELIIKKLSSDLKTTSTFITNMDYEWTPVCLYCSMITGDLLVGLLGIAPGKKSTFMAKITRYNNNGELTQTIRHDKSKNEIYENPFFITENNNGDIVVSDIYRVVVTNKMGQFRFFYFGQSGELQRPEQICTDVFSHILVCYKIENTVEMINKDGRFLLYLLYAGNFFTPWSLSYDANSHVIWVGSSEKNILSVWRYIARKDSLLNGNYYHRFITFKYL